MNVEIFTACDFAQENMGKLTAVGCFDAINARSFPIKHPFMCIAIRIRFMMHELGKHAIALELLDPDGGPVIPRFQGNLDVSGGGTDTTAVNLVLNNIGIEFKDAGKHMVRLVVDGEPAATLPLHLRQVS